MRYVRHLKLQPEYDANTTHVVYGQVSRPSLTCCNSAQLKPLIKPGRRQLDNV